MIYSPLHPVLLLPHLRPTNQSQVKAKATTTTPTTRPRYSVPHQTNHSLLPPLRLLLHLALLFPGVLLTPHHPPPQLAPSTRTFLPSKQPSHRHSTASPHIHTINFPSTSKKTLGRTPTLRTSTKKANTRGGSIRASSLRSRTRPRVGRGRGWRDGGSRAVRFLGVVLVMLSRMTRRRWKWTKTP